MRGVALINNVMYVVCRGSSIIRTYIADKLSPISKDIHVEGMTDPWDIVACRHDRHLYVLDRRPEWIWRVSTQNPSQYEQWLTLQTTGGITRMSLTSRHLLVTSSPRTLHQYNITDRRLLCEVPLPQFVRKLLHAVETARETFIVGHYGTEHSERQHAVSKHYSLSPYVVSITSQLAILILILIVMIMRDGENDNIDNITDIFLQPRNCAF